MKPGNNETKKHKPEKTNSPNTGRDNPTKGGGTQQGINKESGGPTGFGRGKIATSGNSQTSDQGLSVQED